MHLFRYILWATSLLFYLFNSAHISATAAGFDLEHFNDPSRNRQVMIDWWYPVEDQIAKRYHYGLGQGLAVEAGTIATGKFPLIMLSHGAFGAARNYSWLAEILAQNGYVVAGISHFGESYVYGPQTVDPSAVLRSWQRPLDISAALTFIQSSSRFRNSVDLQRIGYVGHSSGGATAMDLAGVTFDADKIASYCASEKSIHDLGCLYGRHNSSHPVKAKADPQTNPNPNPNPNPKQKISNLADNRISHFVALDPALGPGYSDFTQVSANAKMLIVGSIDNDFLPIEHHAKALAKHFNGAQTHWIADGAGHFVYLNECEADLNAQGVALCKDRDDVSRADIHKILAAKLLQFFHTIP